MAENHDTSLKDGLDAFLDADEESIAQAADYIDAPGRDAARSRSASESETPKTDGYAVDGWEGYRPAPARRRGDKYIAMGPRYPREREKKGSFVLIPAGIQGRIPLWGWLAGLAGTVLFIAGAIAIPELLLSRQIHRLGDANPANVSLAMRRLLARADRHTVRKLHDTASSPREKMTLRLRAIDVMGLIDGIPDADNFLLRLELSTEVNPQVSAAAAAARQQRRAQRQGDGS